MLERISIAIGILIAVLAIIGGCIWYTVWWNSHCIRSHEELTYTYASVCVKSTEDGKTCIKSKLVKQPDTTLVCDDWRP